MRFGRIIRLRFLHRYGFVARAQTMSYHRNKNDRRSTKPLPWRTRTRCAIQRVARSPNSSVPAAHVVCCAQKVCQRTLPGMQHRFVSRSCLVGSWMSSCGQPFVGLTGSCGISGGIFAAEDLSLRQGARHKSAGRSDKMATMATIASPSSNRRSSSASMMTRPDNFLHRLDHSLQGFRQRCQDRADQHDTRNMTHATHHNH